MPRCSAYHSRSASGSLARKKTPPTPSTLSATNALPRPAHELGEDGPMRLKLFEACVLTLGRVRLRDGQVGRGTDLLCHRQHPFDQGLDAGAGRYDLAALEVDQPIRQTMADRAPHVLLDQTVREIEQRLALVERTCETRTQSVHQGNQGLRLSEVRLGVADPDLDRREGQVGPDAPPHLRVLVDGVRVVKEPNVSLKALPAVVRVRHAAAREELREDLRARRVQTRDAILDERRARREREQLRQDVAESVANGHRPICASDADVRVNSEAVVAPDDVPEDFVVSPVVRCIDDALVLPAAPRMRSGARQRHTHPVGKLRQLRAAFAHSLRRLPEVLATPRLHLDIGGDQLADEMLVELRAGGGGLQLLEAVRELERLGIEQREFFLDRESEIFPVLEGLVRKTDLLIRGQSLLVAHLTSVFEVMPAQAGVGIATTSRTAD